MECSHSQEGEFVTRNNDTLRIGNKPFYFLGTNAYYLLEQAARGDTQTVRSLFQTAHNIGMTVVRTWGFHDSPDSTNPAVIQYNPGLFNEGALRALDYVIYQAKLHSIRLLIPLVNSWDDYGGMNQYVRWRLDLTPAEDKPLQYGLPDLQRVIQGGMGRSYRYALSSRYGHDDFYSDSTIKSWFRNYMAVILNRVNTFTGIQYKDEPCIFGWELANEPRSSDPSAHLVSAWVLEMATYLKSIDRNHLLGSGEEGFDVSPIPYTPNAYNNQHWLFDGSTGASFSRNSVIEPLDFASCHLYPEAWNLPYGAGNTWIRDHIRIARYAGKPLVVGEFGVREQKRATYDSWLTTTLLDGAAGGIVWQILEGPRTDREGFGFRCSEEELLCVRLQVHAERFKQKSQRGTLLQPEGFSLHQNYPNPFNGVTTIAYALPFDARVEIAVYNILGQRVTTVVNGMQRAGERRELLDAKLLASGSYMVTMVAHHAENQSSFFAATKKFVVMR